MSPSEDHGVENAIAASACERGMSLVEVHEIGRRPDP
jgi:hypothetical protein